MGLVLIRCLLVLVLVAGCSPAGTQPSVSSTSTTQRPPPDSTTTSLSLEPRPVPSKEVGRVDLIEPQPAPANIDEAVAQAIDDLTQRSNVDPEAIEVQSAGAVTWNDGSIGCPEPGRMYTQALVSGFRVVLTVGGTAYAYHAAEGRELFYCPSPAETPSSDL